MLYEDFRTLAWNEPRWPNFTAKEFACPCGCHHTWHWPDFFDRLQSLRERLGKPLRINSGHRCFAHNRAVGGTPGSQHRTLAVDLSTRGFDPETRLTLDRLAHEAGFTGFGYYWTFLHLDLGPDRFWYGNRADTDALKAHWGHR